MADASVLIIGAGLAGLAAGCYAQMNGCRSQIFEMHHLPGGLCTSWKRKDYVFDGSVHWLLGSKPGSAFYPLWEELGALPGRPIVNHAEMGRIEGPAGKTFIVYTNIDRLETHMKELAPGDAAVIDDFIALLRRFATVELAPDKPRALMGVWDIVKAAPMMLGFMAGLKRAGNATVQSFAARFRDPFLRQAFALAFNPPDYAVPEFPLALATMLPLPATHRGDAGYPVGGSLELARAIERRYLNLGGQIHYRARVEKILVEDGRAVGVRLQDGSEARGDIVISAADGRATLFDMLGETYVTDEFRRYYRDLAVFQPLVVVSLGVARDFSREPHDVLFPLNPPATLAGRPRDWLRLRHFCYDPTMAPTGKSALQVWLGSDFNYWNELRNDPPAYAAEKSAIAESVLSVLETRFPGLRRDVEVVDVATPYTTWRYTGNWQGSPQGWAYSPATLKMLLGQGIPKTLPGVANFYMAGQWVEPGGGLPAAVMSGRNIMQIICRRTGRRFHTTRPCCER